MDIILPIIFIALGIFLPLFFNISSKHKEILILLWLYHLIFSVYYCFFLKGVDAFGYWRYAAKKMTPMDFNEQILIPGTHFMNAICYPFANTLGFSYFSLTLFFSLIGFIGIILTYKMFLELVPKSSKLCGITIFPFIMFLPNLHLWSVAVGKDSLLFFTCVALVYSLIKIKKRLLLAIFSFWLTFNVRPHCALIFIIALGYSFLFGAKVSASLKIIISTLLFAGILILSPVVFEMFGVTEVDEVVGAFDSFSSNLSYGNTAVDISKYPYPLKLLSYLYRPFFFIDRMKLTDLVIMFENLFVVLLTIKVFKSHPIRAFKASPFIIKFSLMFFLFGAMIFCMVMSNLGLIIRQRNIFYPCMLLFFVWVLSYNNQMKLNR
ncbi:MAG: hypothetical protein LBO06_01295 [Bacteroidales bacterium]|jgi:hypothetical protein|nr:hypothetical protein [Bacteroidales bacterium]